MRALQRRRLVGETLARVRFRLGMMQIAVAIDRPVEALHRRLDAQIVEDARDDLLHPPRKAGHMGVDVRHVEADLLGERPCRGEAQRGGGEAPAGFAARHHAEILLHETAGDEQRRVGVERDGAAGDGDFVLARDVEPREAGWQKIREQRQRLALGRARGVLLAKHDLAPGGQQRVLLGEVAGEVVVGLDPVARIERAHGDGEGFGRAVIRGVGEHGAPQSAGQLSRIQRVSPSSFTSPAASARMIAAKSASAGAKSMSLTPRKVKIAISAERLLPSTKG